VIFLRRGVRGLLEAEMLPGKGFSGLAISEVEKTHGVWRSVRRFLGIELNNQSSGLCIGLRIQPKNMWVCHTRESLP
jgi:hypothetical protein